MNPGEWAAHLAKYLKERATFVYIEDISAIAEMFKQAMAEERKLCEEKILAAELAKESK